MRRRYWFLLVVAVLVLDQLSKYWANTSLTPYQPMPVMPLFNLTLAYNSGAAFSFLSGAGAWHRWFFVGFSLVVSAILMIWLWRTPTTMRLQPLGISLILGGAIGNLIDRGLNGYVVDFIDLYYKHYHFATFNIADSAITVGAVFLILDVLIHRK